VLLLLENNKLYIKKLLVRFYYIPPPPLFFFRFSTPSCLDFFYAPGGWRVVVGLLKNRLPKSAKPARSKALFLDYLIIQDPPFSCGARECIMNPNLASSFFFNRASS